MTGAVRETMTLAGRADETAGLLAPQGRTEGGCRIYGEPALKTLRIIEQARLAGFTLAEVKALRPAVPGSWNRPSLLTALYRRLAAVEDMRRQLSRSGHRIRAASAEITAIPAGGGCAAAGNRIAPIGCRPSKWCEAANFLT
jgi:DNA-binding transcriptional MerR regulator